MLALIPVLAFITIVLFFWAMTPPTPQSVENRLRKHGYMPTARVVVDLNKPFSRRILSPLLENFGRLLARFAPPGILKQTKEKLDQANLSGISPHGFLSLTVVLSLLLPLLFITPFLRTGHLGLKEIVIGIALFILGIRLPDFWLSRKIKSRQDRIRKSLPDALDLITICIEAGYGLDAALAKVGEKTKGPLADEIGRALLEINLGKPRSQALRDMAQRVRVSEFQSFIATIIQAEQMGVSIADIMRVHSDSMRIKRRQEAEEQAMKAPVKMLFPLVLFILPAMFIVILGPVAMRIAAAFIGIRVG
ncbi:MAG: type II secretion system F family protein [Chloroflexi bacterium]|nr:type II secretion system F family protein [Chloroflexota bacterium]